MPGFKEVERFQARTRVTYETVAEIGAGEMLLIFHDCKFGFLGRMVESPAARSTQRAFLEKVRGEAELRADGILDCSVFHLGAFKLNS